MSVLISPNMSLPIPDVGSESGPDYAYDVNSCLTLLDQHSHTPGSGVPITSAAINIDNTLSFNSQQLTSLLSASFTAQNAATSVIQALSVAPGTESPTPIQDLWYTDSNGTAIQLTSNGLVNAIIGSLPGESYSAGTFYWKQGSGSTIPANFDIGSIVIRPNVAATSFGVTLQPPSAIASAYALTLPADPSTAGGSNFLVMDTSGVISGGALVDNSSIQYTSHQLSVKAGGITSAMLANPILASYQDITSSGSFTVPSNVTAIWAYAVGGGGGGGSGDRNAAAGGQGGCGSMPQFTNFLVTPGQVLTITIGGGGSGGALQGTSGSPGNNGSQGGTTLIQSSGTTLLQAVGGNGGTGGSNGGAQVSAWAPTRLQVAGGTGGSNGNAAATGSGGTASPAVATGGGGGGGGYICDSSGTAGVTGGHSASGSGASTGGVGYGAGGGGGQAGSSSSGNFSGAGGAGANGVVRLVWVAP